jgi:hypothetical protein
MPPATIGAIALRPSGYAGRIAHLHSVFASHSAVMVIT